MKDKRTRSVISENNSTKEIRVIPHKSIFEREITKIFSKGPSHLGYKGDINNLISDIGLNEEDFLYLTILSLGKIVRNKNDTRIITSYLYSMNNLINFLKESNDKNKTDQEILKDLLNLSKTITYEKYDKNHIITRFGEIGTTAYVILRGNIDVLIKNFKVMSITKYDYLYYLANLIRYGEYGLLNEVINENFNVYPLELEDKNEKNENKPILVDKRRNNTAKNIEESPVNNTKDNLNLFQKINTEEGLLKRHSQNKTKSISFKLNEKNMELKSYKRPFKITTDKLLELFGMKRINNKNLHCPFFEYINRLNLIPGEYRFYINQKLMYEIEKENEKENKIYNIKKVTKEEDSLNTLYFLKIFSYRKVINLGKGTLFGELALTQENSLRTGTIITSKECDMTVFNKKTFNNCLRKGAAVFIKKLLSFFVDLPIFKGISEYIFYHKYYTYLSKKILSRGNILISQGEPPKGIILLQSGSYGISSRISLDSLTEFITHLIKVNLNEKSNNNEACKKYQKQLLKIDKMIDKAKSLMNENPKFKWFYTNEINLRVTELSSPDIIGFKEYVNEKGVYSFTIEAHSNENIFYILDNKFYSEILHKNHTIRRNQVVFSEKKINVIIHRLIILRNCYVNFFFENKVEKINSIISKELDIMNHSKIRQKSALKNRITEYNFTNKRKELENKKERIGRNDKPEIKSFSSFNQAETIKNDLPTSNNSFSLNFHPNKTTKNHYQINKISNNLNSLYKTSNNYFQKENKKKLIFESKNRYVNFNYIKDNSDISSDNKTNIFKKDDKKGIRKINYFNRKNRNNKNEMNFPRLNSSMNSCRNVKYTGILMNNMVLEEINKKIKDKLILNDNSFRIKEQQLISSMMTNSLKKNNEEKLSSSSINYNRIISQYKHPYLRKSSSESMFKNNIRIKSKLIKNTMKNKNRDFSTNKAIKIDLNIQRIFSPLEISSSKTKENSISDKIKINSKNKKGIKLNQKFFKNNLKNRVKIFYNRFKLSKK